MFYIISAVSTFFIALLAGSMGIGGGFLFTPVFTWLGLDYKISVIPMALLLNLVITLTAQRAYLRENLTDTKLALIMSGIAIFFAQLGAYINHQLPAKTLMMIFSIFLIFVAIDMLFICKPTPTNFEYKTKVGLPIALIAGALAGTLSGLLGLGGGFIIMPMLLLVGYHPKKAAATSSLVVFFSSASGLLAHLDTQNIDLRLALICIVFVILGAKAGAYFMVEKCSPTMVRKYFGILLVFISIKIFFDVF